MTSGRIERRLFRPALGATVRVAVVGLVIAGALLWFLAVQIAQARRTGRGDLQARAAVRLASAEGFVDAYVADLLDQVGTHARTGLAGPAPSADDFARVSAEMRFGAAVLLDSGGKVVQVVPANPALTGKDLTGKYEHLRAAVAGRPTVSVVVPAAATGAPIVAFAVPFSTPYGNRVFSGGFNIKDTPLGVFLRSSKLITGQAVYLVDRNGRIVAGDAPNVTGTLIERDPALAAASAIAGSGTYAAGDHHFFFVDADIPSAPWRIVTSMPTAALYRPIDANRTAPWVLFAGFAAAALAAIAMVTWSLRQRRTLQQTNSELAAVSSELTASEQQVRQVIETAGDAFVAIDGDGNVTAWNQQATVTFGWPAADAIGQPLHTLIIPEQSRAAHLAGLRRFSVTGQSTVSDQRLELEAQHADGTVIPVELSIWPQPTPSGSRFNAIIRDISERHRQQQALRDSEQRLRLTQQNAATGMALVGLDGRWLEVNPALCALTGRTAEELAGLTFLDITHPDDLETDVGLVGQLVSGDIANYQMDKRYLRPDGRIVWVQIHVALLRTEQGEPEQFIVQILDIEDRKHHEAALAREVTVRGEAEQTAHRERDFLAVLLTSIGEGYLYTVNGKIVDVNDQFCTLTGYTKTELIGSSRPYPFWPLDKSDQYRTSSDNIRTIGGGDIEIILARKNGEPFPAALTVRAVPDTNGTTRGYITTVRDLTDVRRREDALIADAATDPLTGLMNRRSIDQQLARLRPGDAVIVLDLDHFKTVNDTHGHASGDDALTTLAGSITATLRGKDWAGRLGGEEFIIVVRDGQNSGAESVIARLRATWNDTAPLTTFSAGIAVHTIGDEPARTLARSDHAMYIAKRNGRNRTVHAT